MVTKLDETYEEPSQKNKQNNPSFLSLPDEIILNCLARISRSYYPRLSLVCKTFCSLVVSDDLNFKRYQLKTQETVVHVYLQFRDSHRPSVFTLWIKPCKENERLSTGDVRLVQTPSSYISYIPMCPVSVGSEWYGLSQSDDPSSIIYIYSEDIYSRCFWREATNMTVAREKPLACDLNGKLYVMGGCGGKKPTNSGEVFDPKTQSWEPLPVPSPELRFSSIRKIEAIEGKLYVRSNEKKDSVYDPETDEWKVTPKSLLECAIDDVWYCCDRNLCCSWYDTNREEWRVVRGLAMLNKYGNITGMIEITDYGGKLLILWDKISCSQPGYSYKHIWCAMIALERRREGTTIDEVWGNIEWADIVHTVPSSYVFVRSLLSVV